jgi:hypothetical protein
MVLASLDVGATTHDEDDRDDGQDQKKNDLVRWHEESPFRGRWLR